MSKEEQPKQDMMPGFDLPRVEPIKKSSRPSPKAKVPDHQVVPIAKDNTPVTSKKVEPVTEEHRAFQKQWDFIAYQTENPDDKRRLLLHFKRECGHYEAQSFPKVYPTSIILQGVRGLMKQPCPTCEQ